jgi:hypothetical protein
VHGCDGSSNRQFKIGFASSVASEFIKLFAIQWMRRHSQLGTGCCRMGGAFLISHWNDCLRHDGTAIGDV